MRPTLRQGTVIVGLAAVGLLSVGATANASVPTPVRAMTATTTASAPPDERICCVSGPYSSYPTCERVRKSTPRSIPPCFSDETERHWYFAYRP